MKRDPPALAVFILGWRTTALQTILDLLAVPPVPRRTHTHSPTAPQPAPGTAVSRPPAPAHPGMSLVPPVSPAVRPGCSSSQSSTANAVTAVIALRRPRSTLRRFPGCQGD